MQTIEQLMLQSGRTEQEILQAQKVFPEIAYVKQKSPEDIVLFTAMTVRLMKMLNPILVSLKDINIANNEKIQKMGAVKGLKIGLSIITQMIRVGGELDECLEIIQNEAKQSFGLDIPLNNFKDLVANMTQADKDFLDLFFTNLDDMKKESETILLT